MTRQSCPTFEELSQLFSAKNREMIASHLATCDACAAAWADLEALREAAQQIPTRTPSAAEAIHLEDRLLAAALAPAPSVARWRRYAAPLAAAAVAAGVTLFFTARPDDAPRTAVVQAPAGAQFEHFTRVERDAPREVVRVREGRVSIEAADETAPLEVLTADGTIEVKSSDFEVVVVDDRLSEVFVRSGEVAVRTPDGTTHIVRLGERWTRPARRPEEGVASNATRGAPPGGAETSPREGGSAASMGADAASPGASEPSRTHATSASSRAGAASRGASASSRAGDASAPSRAGDASSASASSRAGAASRGASASSRAGAASRDASASSRAVDASSASASSRAGAASRDASASSRAGAASRDASASSRTGAASPGASPSAADAASKPAAPRAGSASAGEDASPDAGTTTPPLPTPAERAFASGWRRLRAGDPTTAAERFAEVLEHQPGGALAEDARYWRAAALAKADAAAATPALRAYLSAHPDGRRSAEVALMLAWRRLADGDEAEAKTLFERAEATGDARVKRAARRGLEQL